MNLWGLIRRPALDALINANKGKLVVTFSESSECGVIVRSLAPLWYKSWSKIPVLGRDSLIERVKNKFIMDTYLLMVKEFVEKSMAKKYTNHRRGLQHDSKQETSSPQPSESFKVACGSQGGSLQQVSNLNAGLAKSFLVFKCFKLGIIYLLIY